MLGIKDNSVKDSLLNGINLNEKVSPKDFLKSIGVDPHKIVSALEEIKHMSFPKIGTVNFCKTSTRSSFWHPNRTKSRCQA